MGIRPLGAITGDRALPDRYLAAGDAASNGAHSRREIAGHRAIGDRHRIRAVDAAARSILAGRAVAGDVAALDGEVIRRDSARDA